MKILSLTIAAFAATTLCAQTTGAPDMKKNEAKSAVETQDPKAQDDGSWIAISGKVKSTGNDDFVLDHGDGTITVKLQPQENVDGEHKFIEDENVTVFGVVDEGFFKSTTILARAVYVESLSTYVYRTDGVDAFLEVATPVIPSGTVIQGNVTKVDGNKVVLDDGDRNITVDTSILKKDEDPNTLDNVEGIGVGDRVVAVGVMDKDFWTGRKFRATSIMSTTNMQNMEGEMQGSGRDY